MPQQEVESLAFPLVSDFSSVRIDFETSRSAVSEKITTQPQIAKPAAEPLPKIRPHHAAMVARVAEIAGLDAKRVSIKATTTEKLGFTGRGEGIAAHAVVLIERA